MDRVDLSGKCRGWEYRRTKTIASRTTTVSYCVLVFHPKLNLSHWIERWCVFGFCFLLPLGLLPLRNGDWTFAWAKHMQAGLDSALILLAALFNSAEKLFDVSRRRGNIQRNWRP